MKKLPKKVKRDWVWVVKEGREYLIFTGFRQPTEFRHYDFTICVMKAKFVPGLLKVGKIPVRVRFSARVLP